MRPRKSREASSCRLDELRDAGRGSAAQTQNADREREQVLYAMIHFPNQELLSL
jgi:hypothetical protein